jgi:hypothetical protein
MEEKTTYTVSQDLIVNRSFSMSLRHVAMITDLAERLGLKDSAVIRMAVEELYGRLVIAETKLPAS